MYKRDCGLTNLPEEIPRAEEARIRAQETRDNIARINILEAIEQGRASCHVPNNTSEKFKKELDKKEYKISTKSVIAGMSLVEW